MHDTELIVQLIAIYITANVTNRKPKDKVVVKCYPNLKVENTKRIVYDYTFNKRIKCILGALQLQCKVLGFVLFNTPVQAGSSYDFG